MPALTIRRAVLVLALAAGSILLPVADLSATPRSESRWNGPERVLRQGLSFWHVLTSIFERAGARIDGNG